MRLSLRQLLIFTAVADTGSTSAAGDRIALSQSATSGALNELEALLGAQLFDRIGWRLLLNDNGRLLLPQAREMLGLAQEIETLFDADGGGTGAARLRIGASTTIGNYLLPALVAGYERDGSAAAVDILIDNTRAIAAAVARLEVDAGLIEGPCPEPDLRVLPWRDDELVLVCGASHPLAATAASRRLPVEALARARWLQREPGSGTREAVEQLLLPHLHHLDHALQLGSTEAIKQAAVAGMGLACLSRSSVEDLLAWGRLVVLDTALPPLSRRFYLVCHRQKRLSATLQKFLLHIGAGV